MAIVAGDSWWSLDDTGRLEVSCVGDMSYEAPFTPWLEYKNDIQSVVIQNSVTNIGDNAFEGCENLTSVTIGSGVTSIGESAFETCTSLPAITIPGSVVSIGARAFTACESLTSMTVPNGVTSIGDEAFVSCTALTSVTIPSSVTSIGSGAFGFCDALTDIYYGGTETQWNALDVGDYNDLTIHYTAGTQAVVIPAIPITNLGNPLAAVVQTLNFVIQNLNAVLASDKITGIMMNGVSKGTNGVVNLGTVITDVSGKADASTVNTLIGSDTGKSVRTIANEELAARLIPANAQEALDTLQEISAWIQSHPGEVAAINHKLTLGTVNGTEYATVKAYVEAMVSGLITLSALSATVTGAGNAVTGVSYDNATGAFSFVKALTFLTAHQDISGKVDKITGKGLSTNDYTDADKAAVETIGNKVNKVTGKGLSTNDYTDADKNKLSGIEAQANKTTIDSTLSNSGQAADAKTVGDLFHRMALYFDASGNPVTFSDAKAANIQALSVTLTPTQSGSGTPSPTNIRPISGVSSVRVTCHNAPSGTLTITPAQSGSGTPSPSNVRRITPGLSFVRDDNSTLTVYGGTLDVTTGTLTVTRSLLTFTDGTGWRVSTADNGESFLECPFASNNDQPETMTRSNLIVVSSHYPTVSTLASGKRYGVSGYRRYAYFFTGDETPDLESFTNWLIAQNAAGTPFQMLYTRYQPAIYQLTPTETERALAALGYAGNAIVVPLVDSNSNPLTVYGGTLDVTTGTLTVTTKKVTFNGSETWIVMTNAGGYVSFSTNLNDISPIIADGSGLGNIICSRYTNCTAGQQSRRQVDNGVSQIGTNIRIRDISLADKTAAEFKTWLAEHPVEVVYPLATPVTYTLTPAQLATLSGYNAISTDAETLSVTYRADPSITLGGG